MAINISHLNKHIGKQHVLKDICLSIGDGEVVGLLGPNGAGKSTLMKIMVGVWEPTSLPKGQEMVLQVPKNIGFLPEQNPLYEDMYVREYLRFFVELRLKAIRRLGDKEKGEMVEELIERVGLTAEANKRVGQLSKGYKQRVGLAQAMIGDPELLILDEPTAGLDPAGRDEILDLISKMHKELGITVILVSHSMEDVAKYVGRIIVMNQGEVMYDGTPKEVFSHYKELESVGLAAPQVTYIMNALAEKGFPVSTDATTIEEATEAIYGAYQKR